MRNQEIKFKGKNHNYSVMIGKNILGILPKKVKILCPKTKNVALIIDKNIPVKFKKELKKKLKNYTLLFLSFEASEKNKPRVNKMIIIKKIVLLIFFHHS